jgi:hypothetical protein
VARFKKNENTNVDDIIVNFVFDASPRVCFVLPLFPAVCVSLGFSSSLISFLTVLNLLLLPRFESLGEYHKSAFIDALFMKSCTPCLLHRFKSNVTASMYASKC